MSWLSNLFKTSGKDQLSPQDWLPQDAVQSWVSTTLPVDKLAVKLNNRPKIWTPHIPDTNSMDAVSDFGHNNIYISGADETDHKKLVDFLKVGDVAVYRFPADPNKSITAFISHRIVKIGKDKFGRYFRFKGDNNNGQDNWVVRDENIKWISLGVIY